MLALPCIFSNHAFPAGRRWYTRSTLFWSWHAVCTCLFSMMHSLKKRCGLLAQLRFASARVHTWTLFSTTALSTAAHPIHLHRFCPSAEHSCIFATRAVFSMRLCLGRAACDVQDRMVWLTVFDETHHVSDAVLSFSCGHLAALILTNAQSVSRARLWVRGNCGQGCGGVGSAGGGRGARAAGAHGSEQLVAAP